MSVRPRQHGPPTIFLAVVRANHLGQAACDRQTIQNPRQQLTADRPFRHDGDRLVRGVIDDGQALDYPYTYLIYVLQRVSLHPARDIEPTLAPPAVFSSSSR